MASRFGCLLGRLSATPVRGYQLQHSRSRFITSSAALWNNKVSSSKPAESKSSSRGGLTGFLQEKTGVTGAWMLGVGVSALLVSKELYIINSETIIAVVFGGVVLALIKKIGKPVADFLDSKSKYVVDIFTTERDGRKEDIEYAIAENERLETELELRHDIFEVMRENNTIRLEEEYRRRLHQVTNTVKRQLDYHVDMEQTRRKFEQEHTVQWLERAVTELVKGKQDESLVQCVTDLKKMTVA